MFFTVFIYFYKFLYITVILLVKFIVLILAMCSNVKSALCRSYENIKNKNVNINGVNSEKILTKNDFIETKQGDSLPDRNLFGKSVSECSKRGEFSEELRNEENQDQNQEKKVEQISSKIDDLITKVLNERGEEYIKIRIDCGSQEIKEINSNSDTVFDLNALQIEKYKRSLDELLNDNRIKLNRLKEQLEFGKNKLLQANKSIVHLTGIKKVHEFNIEDQIKKRDNILKLTCQKENKSTACRSIDSIPEKSINSKVIDFEKSGYKALQNIQNLLEQKRHWVKEIGEKENVLKEKIVKVEEEKFFDPEWVPSKLFMK